MAPATIPRARANPRGLPQPLTLVLGALSLLGAAAFVYGLFTDPQTAWLAFHANFVYFAYLGQGGLVLAAIFVVVGASWPGPLKRIAEAMGAWVPVTFVLALLAWLLGSGDYLFEWQREGAIHGKEAWLNPARFYLTDFAILGALAVLSVLFLRASARPTLEGAAERTQGFARGLFERWSRGWRGAEQERKASYLRQRNLAPAICLLYAFGFSIFAFDQVMSMEQSWYSNLFGAYVSWGGILSAVAALAVLSLLHRGTPGLDDQVTSERLHDVGKMLFAFSIFWMYLFFSQYLVIWYGNLPEETIFLRDRLGPQFLIDKGFTEAGWARAWIKWDFRWDRLSEAYGWTSMAVWACLWIIPFWVLLGERPKKTPMILGPVAAIMLIGFWIERNLLIWPSVIKDQGFSWLGPLQIAIALGFFGAFGLVYLVYTRVFPSLAVPER
jgi:hypothetical protein